MSLGHLLSSWPGRMKAIGSDPIGASRRLETPEGSLDFYSLEALERAGVADVNCQPGTVKVLLESLIRRASSEQQVEKGLSAMCADAGLPGQAIDFLPVRVLLQDHSGLPVLLDLAGMRTLVARAGGDPASVELRVPADLVIDHSVQVDVVGSVQALDRNLSLEYGRNRERYEFLRWAAGSFSGLRVVPPGRGIVHQVNLESLATVVALLPGRRSPVAVPDTLVGTDSHTPTVNGLGVLGWGVGGIEAQAVILGQPLALPSPRVVGVRLVGELPAGVMATDVVLTITQRLREYGVVAALVEFFGEGCASLSVPDRATVANMAPEYGATAALFPIDGRTLEYLTATGREPSLVDLVERYAKAQGLFREGASQPAFRESVDLDLSTIEPSVAGPNRPQQRISLSRVSRTFQPAGGEAATRAGELPSEPHDGAVAIAAITSCTNTSNPVNMLAAGLLARRARDRGLRAAPWVKTSLAPGSRVVWRYLKECGLAADLEALGFNLVGFGCTTCIGNSGPLLPVMEEAMDRRGVRPVAVLSGNRNFERRIHAAISASYLASPPLVVAYALAGTIRVDLTADALGHDRGGKPVYLRDLWPSPAELARLSRTISPEFFRQEYRGLFDADPRWAALDSPSGQLFEWRPGSTYLVEPPLAAQLEAAAGARSELVGARALVVLGDGVTTDHISPAGAISSDSPAGRQLLAAGVQPPDFNTYGCRRGNHAVMVAGTFANPSLRNHLVSERAGGWTRHLPSGEVMSIPEAAQRYQREGVPLVVLAGRDYGMGSSRDWAAKGQAALGVRAVLAEGYERIHRTNLVGCGVLPLQFRAGESWRSLVLSGEETFVIAWDRALPGELVPVHAHRPGGRVTSFAAHCRIDSQHELDWYRQGGVVALSLRRLLGIQLSTTGVGTDWTRQRSERWVER